MPGGEGPGGLDAELVELLLAVVEPEVNGAVLRVDVGEAAELGSLPAQAQGQEPALLEGIDERDALLAAAARAFDAGRIGMHPCWLHELAIAQPGAIGGL